MNKTSGYRRQVNIKTTNCCILKKINRIWFMLQTITHANANFYIKSYLNPEFRMNEF